ncbi:hypothetical protein H0H93_005741 [Arthromyces matolae]|nr:hypothetical protein H0H93_005741 [Arthromyces matolae]
MGPVDRDGPSTLSGWRTWYTQSGFISSPDQLGQGNSYHITSLKNASATFHFYASSQRSLPSFEASDDFVCSASSPSPKFYDSNDTSFVYNGTWSLQTQSGVPNATVTVPFHQTTQENASVSFSFTGADAVVVKGLSDSENGLYSVTLDGATSILNGTSSWSIPDALLFFRAGLNPNSTHEITLANLGSRLCLNSVTVFEHEARDAISSPPNKEASGQSPKRNVGMIAGLIAGIVLLLAVIGVLGWFLRRRNVSGSKNKLAFSQQKHKSRTPPPRPPSGGISPMLATLNQEDRFTSDVLSTYTGVSSDIHSSTNLLHSHGHRSEPSGSESSIARSQTSETESFAHWATPHGIQPLPYMPPHFGIEPHLTPQQSISRLTIQTSYSSMSSSVADTISPRRRNQTPLTETDSTRSHRGPLPPIPIPSYRTAVQGQEPTLDEVRHFADQREAPRRYSALTTLTAPPQYEQL